MAGRRILARAIASVVCAAGCTAADAATTTLTYDYMATNLYGTLAVPVATLELTDLADLGIANPIPGASGGVRAEFRVNAGGLAQFASGAAGTQVFISSYELNFPNTYSRGLPSTGLITVPLGGPAGYLGGYTAAGDGSFTNGYGLRSDNWAYVAGANFQSTTPTGTVGGIEWQEDGNLPQGWGTDPNDPSFGQELNWGNTPIMVEGGHSIVNLFNAPGENNISVESLLGNPVANPVDPALPLAYSWIKLRGTGSADPALRGIAGSGFWGASEVGGSGASTQYRLNVLATVPLPAPVLLLASGLFGVGTFSRRTRKI